MYAQRLTHLSHEELLSELAEAATARDAGNGTAERAIDLLGVEIRAREILGGNRRALGDIRR